MMRTLLALVAAVLLAAAPAAAQTTLSADRLYLGPSSACLLRTGAGAPTGGAACEVYLETGAGDLWIKVGATWINVSKIVDVARGGTGVSTLAANGVLYGNGTAPIGVTAAPAANSVLVGNAGPPAFSSSPTVNAIAALSSVSTPLVSASGALTLRPTGSIVLDPQSRTVVPASNYTVSFGAPEAKFLALHLGELWTENLVAQDVLATIGGRVMVAPTTLLTADLAPGATSITVKHNNLQSGDRLFLQAAPGGIPQVEFLAVSSSASGTAGAYVYQVTRNLDGSGANQWYSGDAVVNTGSAGKGFIDLYALSGILTGYGPTIVGQVRTGPAFNAIAPRWALGNLNNVGYGYNFDVYGAAFGDGAGINLTIDTVNGFRVRNATTEYIRLDTAGNATFSGTVFAAAGTIGGFQIGADSLRDTGDTFGLASTVTGGDDVRFWAGATYANRATAPLRLLESGAMVINNGTFTGNGAGVTNINGGNIQTGTVTATQISAGAVTADKIASGTGTNQIANSECKNGLEGWLPTYNTPAPTYGISIGSPFQFDDVPGTCWAQAQGTSAGQIYGWASPMYPAQAGKRYEASAYLGNLWTSIQGASRVYLKFVDSTGAAISTTTGNPCGDQMTEGRYLYGWCRSSVLTTAPAGTVRAQVLMYQTHDVGQANSYFFFVRAMLAEAKPNQTEVSEWTPAGLTEITGGIIKTGAIQANHIAAGAITADKIAAGTITGDKIAGSTITGTNIAGGTITGGHVAANTITGGNIAADSITSAHIAAGTITASDIATSTITGDRLAGRTVTAGNIATNTITATEIAGGSITADKLSVSSLSAISANLGTVTAGNISGNTITGGSISGTNITGSTINAGGGNGVTLDNGGMKLGDGGGAAEARIKFSNGAVELWGNSAGTMIDSGNLDVNGNGHVFGFLTVDGTFRLNGATTGQFHLGDHLHFNGGQTIYWDAQPQAAGGGFPLWFDTGCNCMARSTSSARYKTNLRPWAPADAMALLELPLYRYDFKADPGISTGARDRVGVLAEDLALVAPDAVIRDPDGRPDGVLMDSFNAYLVAALRAMRDRVAKVEALEARIAELEKTIARLEAARGGGKQ